MKIKKECAECGNSFLHVKSRAPKFCSRKCYGIANGKEEKVIVESRSNKVSFTRKVVFAFVIIAGIAITGLIAELLFAYFLVKSVVF